MKRLLSRRGLMATALVLVGSLLSGCGLVSNPTDKPTAQAHSQAIAPLTVDLSWAATPVVRLGLVAPPLEGEGAEYRPGAEGARVATYRFGLGGAEVELVVAIDNGTSTGALKAVNDLIADSVSGLVVASAGPHLSPALKAASEAGVAVLLPYDNPIDPIDGVWSTGPDSAAIVAQLEDALDDANADQPYLITTSTTSLDLPAAASETWSTTDAMADRIVAALEAGTADSVVIAAQASWQGVLAAAIQNRLGQRQAPILLTPSARTPAFAQALDLTGSLNGVFISVGPDASDATVLRSDRAGDQAAAFFSGLTLAANDPAADNIYGDSTFHQAAQYADTASHDAVVALVRAVEKAQSMDANQVRTALGDLTVTPDAGLAGPELDFHDWTALPREAVTTLYASTKDPGVRPAAAEPVPNLFWFSVNE